MPAALFDFIHYVPQQRRIDPKLGILSGIVHLALLHLLLHFIGDLLYAGHEKVADQSQCSGHALTEFWRVGFHLFEAPVCWVAHPLQAVVQAYQHFSERRCLDEIGAGSGQHSGYGLQLGERLQVCGDGICKRLEMVLLRKQRRTRLLESRSLRIDGKEGALQVV